MLEKITYRISKKHEKFKVNASKITNTFNEKNIFSSFYNLCSNEIDVPAFSSNYC